MIRVFKRDETNFSGNGIAVLEKAKDVCIARDINGEYMLTFSLPPGCKWKHVIPENIVQCNGQWFRIKNIAKRNVTAQAIYFDSAQKHIPYIGDLIGVKPIEIMETIFAGTPVHIMTAAEVQDIGLEWIETLTDFFECGKMTPIGAMGTLIEQLERQKAHCELYVDNYNIALVKQLGKDNGAIIDTNTNARSVDPTRDSTSLITRLYPYGKDDLHIGSVSTNGKHYIDSPNIPQFGICEGFANFDSVEEPEELLKCGLWQFSGDNPERIDIPKLSFEIDYIERGKKINLGDIVTVVDRETGITSKQRIISSRIYPYEKQKTRYTVGNPPMSVADAFSGLIQDQTTNKLHTNDKGELKTSWLECMQRNETISINNDLNSQEIAKYRTGALFVSPDGTCAVAIINGRVAISDHRENGEWFWTTISDAGKMIVNEVYTGVLYTSLVQILGDGGKLDITNNLIKFKDENNILRVQIGFVGNQYKFELYNKQGNKTVYLDDDGNMVLTGAFATGVMGMDRTIINGNGIQSYDSLNRKSGLWCNIPDKDGKSFSDLTLYWMGGEVFQIYNDVGHISILCVGRNVLHYDGTQMRANGVWVYKSYGASDYYQIANTKNLDDLQSYLESKISSLESRVSALESAPPAEKQ